MSLNTKEKKKQCKMGTAVILNANELMSVFSMRNRQSVNEEQPMRKCAIFHEKGLGKTDKETCNGQPPGPILSAIGTPNYK